MNKPIEALKEKAFTGGAEKYLWIPPSLPYYEMQGAYKNSKGFSKILVFSAWEMVPRMIGALVSYEAERLTVGKLVHQIKNQDKKNTGYFADGSRRYPVARLRFNVSNGEVRGMSLFALLYPSKTLGQARQEELLEYLFKEFKDTNGLKKLFIDLSPFSKGKEG